MGSAYPALDVGLTVTTGGATVMYGGLTVNNASARVITGDIDITNGTFKAVSHYPAQTVAHAKAATKQFAGTVLLAECETSASESYNLIEAVQGDTTVFAVTGEPKTVVGAGAES